MSIEPTGTGTRAAASDHALVRAARMGDEAAFAAIVARYGPDMYRYAARLLAHDADAREAVQEAMVSAWKGLAAFEERSALRTWLFRLVHRRAVDLQRRRTPVPVEEGLLTREASTSSSSGSAQDPVQRLLDAELLAALQAALGELGQQQRAVWLLREIEEMSYTEIAETLSMTPDSVRGHLQRGRHAIAERMATWR